MLVPPRRKAASVQQFLVQRDVGLDALHHHLGQRDAHPRDRLLARLAVGDDLADQGIVVGRHEVVGVDVRIHADARAARASGTE